LGSTSGVLIRTCRTTSASFHTSFSLTLLQDSFFIFQQAQGLSGHTSPCGECACSHLEATLFVLRDCPNHPHARDCLDYPCAWGLSRPPSCSETVLTTLVLGTVSTPLSCSVLSRPPSCSGTVLTTLVLGTVSTILVLGGCPDHHRARRLFRPLSCSGLSRPSSCSGTVPTTFVLGDCSDYGYYRGFIVFPMLRSGTAPTTLRSLLGDRSLRLHMICTHIQLRGIYFFSLRPCYKADTSPSSKLGDYIGTMHLLVQLVSLV
jgi:hypothetical protein